MFAVISVSGKQYKISPNDIIEVSKINGEVGSSLVFDKVLLLGDNDKISVGTPTVRNAVVSAKIISQGKGDKLSVRRFKSKVRYRKAMGFRPHITKLEILSIGRK